MPWQDAVRESPEGCRLLLETAAGADDAVFPAGYNPWRGRISIHVRARAEGGRANKEVLAQVAAFFGVPSTDVQLTFGPRGSHKTVHVAVPREVALRRLGPAMEWP